MKSENMPENVMTDIAAYAIIGLQSFHGTMQRWPDPWPLARDVADFPGMVKEV
jgi:hypothetical protein